MLDSASMDLTHLIDPRIAQEVRATGGRPRLDFKDFADYSAVDVSDVTMFAGQGHPRFNASKDVSGSRGRVVVAIEAKTPQSDDPIAAASEKRLRLLAQKFAGAATREDIARIEILTSRLEGLAPRTTQEDIARLESFVDVIEAIDTDLQEARQRFGIR